MDFKYYEYVDNHPQIYIICLVIGLICYGIWFLNFKHGD